MRRVMLSLLGIALISGPSCPSSFPSFNGDGWDPVDPSFYGDPDGDMYLDDDICAVNGWYGDGICDSDCPYPDPDCEGYEGDWCEENGWYGDGICDSDCPYPDPDCEGW